MAEVLGLASSVIAVIQIAGTISTLTYSYISKVKNAKKDIQQLANEVCSFLGVLTTLKVQIDSNSYDATIVKSLGEPLGQCQDDLKALARRLAVPSKKESVMKSLSWPLKERETMDEIAKIGRLKALLILALSADQVALSHATQDFLVNIRTTVEETRQTVNGVQKSARFIIDGVEDVQLNMATLRTAASQQKRWQQAHNARQTSKEHHEVLRWLDKGVDPTTNHVLACALHQAKTGTWFTESKDFTTWIDTSERTSSDHIGHIWLQGIPGAGKTILMSIIIEETKIIANPSCGIAYFYFDFKDVEKQSTNNMLRNIIAQLCKQEAFPPSVVSLYEELRMKQGGVGRDALLSLLKTIVTSFSSVFILLDAMDECIQRTELTESVAYLCSIPSIRLLMTSRPEQDLKDSLKGCPVRTISIQSEAVNHDVKRYVEFAVQQYFQRQKQDIRDRIIATVGGNAHGMFRWASCQIQLLKRVRTGSQIIATLATLPKDLIETYERVLINIPQEDEQFARRVLLFLVLAKRPLTILELAEAMVIEIGAAELDENLRFADPLNPTIAGELLDQILSICGSLVSIKEDHIDSAGSVVIGLAHFSVQEYLLSSHIVQGPAKYYALDHRHGNEEILRICLTYLQFSNFATGCSVNNTEFAMKLRKYPFYLYAAKNWYNHVIDDQMDAKIVTTSASKLLPLKRTPTFESWLQAHISKDIRRWGGRSHGLSTSPADLFDIHKNPEKDQTSIYFASKFGLLSSLLGLLDRTEKYEKSELEWSLLVASSWGRALVVEVLLKHGANPTYRDQYGDTCLHVAVDRGQMEVVRCLTKRSIARPMLLASRNRSLRTPLQRSLFLMEYDIARVLLEAGSDAYVYGCHENTALDLAIDSRKPWLVQLLLEHSGTNLAWYLQFPASSEPLKRAAKKGDSEIVKLLLQYGFRVSGKTDLYWNIVLGEREALQSLLFKSQDATDLGNALHLASRFGHQHIVKLILDKGELKINSLDALQRTPLHSAALSGNQGTVKLLLETGADIAKVDQKGWTALHCAVSIPVSLNLLLEDERKHNYVSTRGDLETVSTLLAHGVDVLQTTLNGHTAVDLYGNAAEINPEIIRLLLKAQLARTQDVPAMQMLHWVMHYEFSDILAVLIQKGVDLDSVNNHKQTALHLAVGKRKIKMVQALLENGARLTSDDEGCTPLHYAAEGGDEEIMRLLLRADANPSVRGYDLKTPLHIAASKRNPANVLLLLKAGFSVLATDLHGMTCLHYAVLSNTLENVTMLLEHGADIEASNKDFNRPLHLAMRRQDVPNESIARMLLAHGADTTLRNFHGKAALHIAAAQPYGCLIDVLADHGADLELEDTEGQRALHIATEHNGWPQVVERLLARGAYVLAGNSNQVTSLHFAAKSLRTEVVNMLLEYGADVKTRDISRKTALHWVFMATFLSRNRVLDGSSVVKSLLKHGADVNAIDEDGWTPLFGAMNYMSRELDFWDSVDRDSEPAALFVLSGADINIADSRGMAVLHWSVLKKDLKTTKFILENGGNVTAISKHSGGSVLHYAILRPDSSIYYARQMEIISTLIDRGADINAKDVSGMTPLHWLVTETWAEVNQKVLIALLKSGADTSIVDDNGCTVLDLAIECEAKKTVAILLEHGATTSDSTGVCRSKLYGKERSKIFRHLLHSLPSGS